MSKCDLGSYKKWKIGNEFRKILLADTDVHTALGNKIFPLVAPENTDGDFITYTRDSYSKEYVKQGLYEDACTVEVLIISDNYDRAVDLAEKVDKALTGRHLLDCGATIDIDIQTSSEIFQDTKYIERIVFSIE